MGVSVTVTGDIKKLLSLDKQLVFAAASALTAVAQEAQTASVKAIEHTFTTRGKWYLPSNRFGMRITPARKDNLEAAVRTAADWLTLHDTAGTKVPHGSFIAIPTKNVRRTKRQIIQKAQRPRNLKRSFVIKTSKGVNVLFQRQGRGKSSDLVAMYILEPRARIKKESTIVEIVPKVVQRRFERIFNEKLEQAIATAR